MKNKYPNLNQMNFDEVNKTIKNIFKTIMYGIDNDNHFVIRDCLDYLRNIKAHSAVLKLYDDFYDVYKMSKKELMNIAPIVACKLFNWYSLKVICVYE